MMNMNIEIFKNEILKQDSEESCFNDEYKKMMACIAGAADCSLEEIGKFLTDFDELTAIHRLSRVTNEYDIKKVFSKMPYKKRKGRLL